MTLSRKSIWSFLVLIGAFVLGGFALWHKPPNNNDASKPKGSSSAAVPVTIDKVRKADLPIYSLGLGTVQGFNTVVVRTRVDGQIDTINFKEGQIVQKDDVLAQIDPRPFQANLDQAVAKKAQDVATLGNAQLDLQRYTKLGEFSTTQQKDTQQTTVKQLTSQIASDEAAIDNAKTQLDYATIRAPIAGVTGFRQVDQGNIVNASTQTGIVTIAQIEPISVIFTVPESELTYINKQMAMQPLKVIALTADGKTTLSEGVLSLVNNQVDTTSGTIRLKGTFENKDHSLWPGLSVSTKLLTNTLKNVLIVPDDAVQHGPDGLYAYAVNAEDKAELRKIKVGQSVGGKTVIETGLTPDERVIVAGQYRVQQGALVSDTNAVNSAEATKL